MKEIFSGEIYEILPTSNGIIFSYCKEVLEESVVVSYKMISFDNGRFTNIAKNIYLITKFGNNYKAIVNNCDNYITTKSIILQNGKVFLLLSDGTAKLLDIDGSPLWTGSLIYRSCTPSDIILHNDALWACYADCDVLLRYNLATMREELRIGGNRSPFNKPCNMFLEGDKAMVSNSGANSLVQIDLKNYTIFDFENFEEPVLQYVNVQENRFVLLKSGLYLI